MTSVVFFCVGAFFGLFGFACVLDNKPRQAFISLVLFTISMLYVLVYL